MLIVSPKSAHLLPDKSLEVLLASIEVGNRSSFDGSSLAQWLKHSVYNRGVASSSSIIGTLTVNFSAGTRSSCVQ